LGEKHNGALFHAVETKGWCAPMKPMPMFPVAPPVRDDVDKAPIIAEAEAAPGEVALDAVIRAQSLAPQVVVRLTTLQDCLWAAVDALGKLPPKAREALGADAIIERAKLLLNGDLEVPEHDDPEIAEPAPSRSYDKASTLPRLA
jgi:hypothetical protein